MGTTEGGRRQAGVAEAGSGSSSSKSAIPQPKWMGRRIKRFKLLDELGRGAMGRVFLAEDTVLRRHVALKLLPAKHRDGRPNHRAERLIREARSVATLEHPNAVTVYEIDESAGVHYIAMELVEGGDLEQLVKMSGPMEVERACQLIAEAAEALSHAHERGVIHRDIKPANLLLTRSGRCKIGDFGLALFDQVQDDQSRSRAVGTPHFIAPEVAAGQGATEASDIYSMGCTLFFLLAAKPPYSAKTPSELLEQHISKPLPDLRELRPDLPERLVQTIEQACAKDPAARVFDAQRLSKILRTFTISTGSGSASASMMPAVTTMAGDGGSVSLSASGTELEAPHAPPMPAAAKVRTFSFSLPLPPRVIWGSIAAIAVIAIGVGAWLMKPDSGAKNAGTSSSRQTGGAVKAVTAGASDASANAVVNGSLEATDIHGSVAGWFIHDRFKAFAQIMEEDGNHFLRLVNEDPTHTVFVDQKVIVDPTWKAVNVSARMRASNFKAGKAAFQDARVAFAFRDEKGNRVGSWPQVPSVREDSQWVNRVVTADVPAGATTLYIQLAIFNATGTVDFDDIHVAPQKME